MSSEIVQAVTSKRSDIPAHYIAISSFGCHKGNTDKKASQEYKALYRAWCDERIGGIKLMLSVHDKRGQIFVAPQDARDVIEESHPQQQAVPKRRNESSANKDEALVCALSAIATNQTTLLHALERIADAVERIAKNPLTYSDDILISEPSNNCFHN